VPPPERGGAGDAGAHGATLICRRADAQADEERGTWVVGVEGGGGCRREEDGQMRKLESKGGG